MTDQLPEVSLTLLQEARAWKLYQRHQDGNPYDGMKDFARLIVHLLDELAKPAHEREPPHCSTCSCGMPAQTPLTDAEIDAIANDGHRNAAGGIYATSVYEFARAIESAHGTPSTTEGGHP